jgi:hypothetical protein
MENLIFGGIWQVDEIGFERYPETSASHPGLKKKFKKIKKELGIDWTTVKWEDLTKPLYSGIAARTAIDWYGLLKLDLEQVSHTKRMKLEQSCLLDNKHYNRSGRTDSEKLFFRNREKPRIINARE